MRNNILVVDNFDSFTYNIVDLFRQCLDTDITVERNNAVTKDSINKATHLVFSPGPGLPSEAGVMPELLKEYCSSKPILGICLGHQAIAETFGGKLMQLDKVYHGLSSTISIKSNNSRLFKGIPDSFNVGRYHSWVVNPNHVPPQLDVVATDSHGSIMALQHKTLPVFGVQFHPESVLTQYGLQIIKNFLSIKN